MLSFKCLKVGCDFVIEDGEHVEDVLQKLQVHYRAQHPRTWLRTHYACEEIERYNQTVEEFFATQYGANWQAQPISQLVRVLQTHVLAPRNEHYYGPALREEAQAYVNDNAQAVDPNANAPAVDVVDRAWIPFPDDLPPVGGF